MKKNNKPSKAIKDQLEALNIHYPEIISIEAYIDIMDRIKNQLNDVSKLLEEVELGKVSYIPKLRISSITLQKLFYIFRTISTGVFPPRGNSTT